MVGPPGEDAGETEEEYWAALAGTLRNQDVLIDAEQLSRLPHDVELSERVRAHLAST